MVWAGPGAGGVAAGPGVCRRIGEGGRAIESADLGGRLPPILTQVAGMAQTDGSLVDAGSLSQYGPHRGGWPIDPPRAHRRVIDTSQTYDISFHDGGNTCI
jgi:hypothetical protein